MLNAAARATVRLLALVLTSVVALTVFAPPAAHADPGVRPVQIYDYDLGDAAFHVPGFKSYYGNRNHAAPIELKARVYTPADPAGQHLPMVVISHGDFWTCAKVGGTKTEVAWPCPSGFQAIESNEGYDYLGTSLAARGMVVISLSADGINAGDLGEGQDHARGRLIYRHLRMWRNLSADGSGALAGAFTDENGAPASPDFRGAVDLTRVGLIGHSRGGRGSMWAAADEQRHLVPSGISLKAVFGLAPAPPSTNIGPEANAYRVTDVPVMVWKGGCDEIPDRSFNLIDARVGGNPVNLYLKVRGANHNDLNSRWAASSHLPGSYDDASHPKGRPQKCYPSYADTSRLQPTLSLADEQRIAATYADAFMARYLQGDTSADALLSGASRPDAGVVHVSSFEPKRRRR